MMSCNSSTVSKTVSFDLRSTEEDEGSQGDAESWPRRLPQPPSIAYDDNSSTGTKSVSFDLQANETYYDTCKIFRAPQGSSSSWPRTLPHPPSMTAEDEDEMENNDIPMCVVFNANTPEGVTMVRVLSEKGLRVVAVVRVFAGRKVKELVKLKRVVVKVADWNDYTSLMAAARGCTRAFLVTKYWERFETPLEEAMATRMVEAAACVGVKSFVMATFEDALTLKRKGQRSQVEPDKYGRIFPSFEGKERVGARAKLLGVSLSHMMNSYWDESGARKTLVLLRGPQGKVIVQPCYKDHGPADGDSVGVFSRPAKTVLGSKPCRRRNKKGWGKQSRSCGRQECPSV